MEQKTRIKFVDNSDAVMKAEWTKINNALAKMGVATLNRARMYAPERTGALKADGRVEIEPHSVVIAFGGLQVPYARRRHYENNLHPDTKYYLQRAGNEVTRQGVQFYL